MSRLPPAGKKACFVAGHLLMLWLCYLMARGGWQQAVINAGTTSAVMEVSMAWFYASGVLFAVLAGLIVAHALFKLLTGRLDDAALVGIAGSEEAPHGESAA